MAEETSLKAAGPPAGKAQTSRPPLFPNWVSSLALLFLTFLVYLPALRNGFVWNDPDYVTRPDLRSLHGLLRIWSDLGATEQYYPVLHSAFWLEHRLWGDSAVGYHFLNILLHGLSAVLFGLFLRRIGITCAWLAAALFAIHPVCVESVAWVSEQKNTLSTFFYLASALVYFRFDRDRDRRLYLGATGLFVLALLTKSVAATLPPALGVVIWWKTGALDWRRNISPLLPWLVMAAAFGLFSAWVERQYIGASGVEFALTGMQRLLVAGRVPWFYLGKLLWPAQLIFIYPRWIVDSPALSQYIPLIATTLIFAFLWAKRDRSRAPLGIALLFVGTLFPVLGFLNVYAFRFSFVADHFQYLACLSILTAVAYLLYELTKRMPTLLGIALFTCVFAALGVKTWHQSQRYKDLQTFYGAIIRDNPQCWLAEYNLATVHREAGRSREAVALYQQALSVRPNYPEAENNLGLALLDLGQIENARSHFSTALQLRPNFPAAHNNLGNAARALGNPSVAILEYQAALQQRPEYAEAAYNIGLTYRDAGKIEEAVLWFKKTLTLRTDFAEAHVGLADCLRDRGRFQDAISEYKSALAISPNLPDALNNLGNILRDEGRTEEAIQRYHQALSYNPELAVVRNNLGIALANTAHMPEAISEFEHAIKSRPAFAEAQNNLGIALVATGKIQEAIPHYEQAIKINAGYADAHLNLALALRQIGQTAEARRHYDEAKRLSGAK